MGAIRKGFSTVMLGKETIELIKKAALNGESIWQTTDRIVKEYHVSRLEKWLRWQKEIELCKK